MKMTAPFNRATGRHVLGKVAWKIHKHNFDLLRELGASALLRFLYMGPLSTVIDGFTYIIRLIEINYINERINYDGIL